MRRGFLSYANAKNENNVQKEGCGKRDSIIPFATTPFYIKKRAASIAAAAILNEKKGNGCYLSGFLAAVVDEADQRAFIPACLQMQRHRREAALE